MLPSGTGREPGRNGPDQRRRSSHESQDHSTSPRAGNVVFGARDHVIDPPFGFGRRQPGAGRHEANQVASVLGLHSAMARGGQQDAPGFRAGVIKVALGAPFAAEQPV
jgi:hypothetical protein